MYLLKQRTNTENDMKTIQLKNSETNQTETIDNVVAIWNEGRTVEYLKHGETWFCHLDECEEIV